MLLPPMPAAASCSISAPGGILSSVANCSIVICAIPPLLRYSRCPDFALCTTRRSAATSMDLRACRRSGILAVRLEPVRARLHDELLCALGGNRSQLGELVDCEVGQRVARGDAVRGQRARDVRVHAFEV